MADPAAHARPKLRKRFATGSFVASILGFFDPASYARPSSPKNRLAISSFVAAILGFFGYFFLITPIIAIVLGIIALRQIKQAGGMQRGRVLAIVGIVLGIAWAAYWVFVTIVLWNYDGVYIE